LVNYVELGGLLALVLALEESFSFVSIVCPEDVQEAKQTIAGCKVSLSCRLCKFDTIVRAVASGYHLCTTRILCSTGVLKF
jgi:hypothetical protein